MTDNEIIKALECCTQVVEDCEHCPYCNNDDCGNDALGNALDLINRQKENYELETERLAHYMKMLNFSIEERNKLSAEIERLEKELDVYKEANILIAQQRDGRDEDIANLDEYKDKLKCSKYKNKAGFVEVVRCKDCKYSERYEACNGSFPLRCNNPNDFQIGIPENHFCSYGKRKQ